MVNHGEHLVDDGAVIVQPGDLALAAQLANQHAELSRQIFEENCKDRELQREIQAQAVRDQLTQAQAQNAALTAQINLTNQLTAQTAYLVAQLKPAETAAA